jgi:hypothetical protein
VSGNDEYATEDSFQTRAEGSFEFETAGTLVRVESERKFRPNLSGSFVPNATEVSSVRAEFDAPTIGAFFVAVAASLAAILAARASGGRASESASL